MDAPNGGCVDDVDEFVCASEFATSTEGVTLRGRLEGVDSGLSRCCRTRLLLSKIKIGFGVSSQLEWCLGVVDLLIDFSSD